MADEDNWVVDPVTQVELRVPDGFEPGSVIRRAQRERDGLLISVCLLPEHGVAWPVWQRGEGLLAENSLPLSPSVDQALRAWSAFWEAHVDMDGNWSSPEDRSAWLRDARDLEDALERELWEIASIERNFSDDDGGVEAIRITSTPA